jgi:NAD(P)-dependent dehydrogenase (short-subunit alcohol dehydrogenase family)
VLVTGAAGDIGHAIAEAFLHQGARVVASDHRGEELAARVKSLSTLGAISGAVAELTHPAEVARLAEAVLAQWGRVDVLVNNAAIQPDGDVVDGDPEAFEQAYRINVRAPYLLCRALVPAMREAHGGAIVNVASVHATAPGPRRVAYATSKTALLGLTRSMAVDLGRDNIRVNAVSPGATMTSQLRDAWTGREAPAAGDIFAYTSRQHPMRRLAEVTDVAEAVVFLAGAEYVTGIELRVDGGFLSSLRLLPDRTP